MKNQVNKKVSTIMLALLAMVIMCVACGLFTACTKECTHSNMVDSEDTATCYAGGFVTHTCPDCTYTYITTTPAVPHKYSEVTQYAATCDEKGYDLSFCTVCGIEKKENFVEPKGHSIADPEVTTVAATCTSTGLETKTCKDCGDVLEQKVLPMLAHEYATTEVAATCGADGYTLNTCKVCGNEEKVLGDKATGEHTYTVKSINNATCAAAGMKTEVCDVCGDKNVVVLPKLEHEYGDAVTVDATCEVKAHKEKTCSLCNEVYAYDFVGEVAGHAYVVESEIAATCKKDGNKIEKCTVCGDVKTTLTPATGNHNWAVDAAQKVAPTCLTAGYEIVTCSTCGDTQQKAGAAALGHEFDVADGATLIVANPATCTTAGTDVVKCARCEVQTVLQSAAALGHDYVAQQVVAATCTTGGYTIEKCANCDNEITTNLTQPTGHTLNTIYEVAVTCTTDGYTVQACATCQQQFTTYAKAEGHKFNATPSVVEATCVSNRFETYTCDACGYEEVKEVQSAINIGAHTWDPAENVIDPATCQQDGTNERTCTVCTVVEEYTVPKDQNKHAYTKAEAGDPEYAVTIAATCGEQGSTIYKCDYCDVRYTHGTVAAMGHNFVVTPVAATCYTEGYEVLACNRPGCNVEKGDRYNVVPKLAHVMTVAHTGVGADKVIYATIDAAGVPAYYDDALMASPMALAACNIFFQENDVNYTFNCDVCAAAVAAEKTVAPARNETYVENSVMLYDCPEVAVDYARVASANHNISTTEDATDSLAETCTTDGYDIFYCYDCQADWGYNLVVDVADGGYKSKVDVAMTHHTAVENSVSGAACTEDAVYSYSCAVCSATLVAGDIVTATSATGTNIMEVWKADENYDATAETITFTDAMLSSSKLGHNWDVADGAEYKYLTLVNNAYVEYGCKDNQEVVLVIKCSRCAALQNSVEGAEFILDTTLNADVANVVVLDTLVIPAHAIVTHTVTEGVATLSTTNVTVYGYDAAGLFTTDVDAIDGTAYEVVLNPNADPDNGIYACGTFTCAKCTNAVTVNHIGDKKETLVNCTTNQKCQFCPEIMKNYAHVAPTYTCKADNPKYPTQYACSECGMPMGDLTAHTVTANEVAAATCTTGAKYELVCGCGAAIDATAKVTVESLKKTAVYTDATAASKAAIDAIATADTTVDPAWLVGNPDGHVWGDVAVKTEAACTTDGAWEIKCTVCQADIEAGAVLEAAQFTGAAAETANAALYAAYKTEIDAAIAGGTTVAFDLNWLVINKLGHTWGNANETLAAWCTTTGTWEIKCTVCQENIATGEVLNAEMFTAADANAVNAALYAAHKNAMDTAIAGGTTVAFDTAWLTIPELGHDEDAGVVTAGIPVCQQGEKTFTCQRCDNQRIEVIAAVPHVFEIHVNPGVKNCLLGNQVDAFKCTNENCNLTLEACVATNDTEYQIKGIVYQANLAKFLESRNVDFTMVDLTAAEYATYATVKTELTFTPVNHTFNKFTTETLADGAFKAPTAAEPGDAFWYCSACGVYEFRTGSVTMDMYKDPAVNMNYADCPDAWACTVEFKFDNAGVIEVVATMSYAEADFEYDETAGGFVLTDAAIAELVTAYTGKVADTDALKVALENLVYAGGLTAFEYFAA